MSRLGSPGLRLLDLLSPGQGSHPLFPKPPRRFPRLAAAAISRLLVMRPPFQVPQDSVSENQPLE
jgi:hypothetical protein